MAKHTGHTIYANRMSANIEDFQRIPENNNLKKVDFRIAMFLSCRLNSKHPTKVDVKQMAETLCIDEKDAKKSIKRLEGEGIIAKESDGHVKGGYRFTYSD